MSRRAAVGRPLAPLNPDKPLGEADVYAQLNLLLMAVRAHPREDVRRGTYRVLCEMLASLTETVRKTGANRGVGGGEASNNPTIRHSNDYEP